MWIRLALMLPTLIVKTVQAIETIKGSGSGSQKAAAVKSLAGVAVEAVEGTTGRDIFNDPEIQALTQAVIDAQVALSNALTKKQAAAGITASPTSPAAGTP